MYKILRIHSESSLMKYFALTHQRVISLLGPPPPIEVNLKFLGDFEESLKERCGTNVVVQDQRLLTDRSASGFGSNMD